VTYATLFEGWQGAGSHKHSQVPCLLKCFLCFLEIFYFKINFFISFPWREGRGERDKRHSSYLHDIQRQEILYIANYFTLSLFKYFKTFGETTVTQFCDVVKSWLCSCRAKRKRRRSSWSTFLMHWAEMPREFQTKQVSISISISRWWCKTYL